MKKQRSPHGVPQGMRAFKMFGSRCFPVSRGVKYLNAWQRLGCHSSPSTYRNPGKSVQVLILNSGQLFKE